ncbi:uncharacterized protein LOC110092487 [Dendrobium catenatum]|uniref:uncharacterized protein LOC110092487 n=1 Tax=Dendrobium catenatum TaxID=906689 RepID=UPI0009F58982|nr:uncharacterized protein LOC110092487 [Dendrobium catenatum]
MFHLKFFNGCSKVLEGFNQNFKGLKEKPLIINEGGLLDKKVIPVHVHGKVNREILSEFPIIGSTEDVVNVDVDLSLKKDVGLPGDVSEVGLANSNYDVNKVGIVKVNSTLNKQLNVRVDNLDLGSFLSIDGRVAFLHAEKELENAKKMDKAIVVKIFDPEALESILSGGPWWIRGKCWDEVNIFRIASLVGKPYLLDRNMFQWSRREFARVKGLAGEFFQKVEYEGLSKICLECGKIRHVSKTCTDLKNKVVVDSNLSNHAGVDGGKISQLAAEKSVIEGGKDKDNAWTQVNHGKKRFNKVAANRRFFNKKFSVPMKKVFIPKTGISNLKVMGKLEKEQDKSNKEIFIPGTGVSEACNSSGVKILNKFDVLSELEELNEVKGPVFVKVNDVEEGEIFISNIEVALNGFVGGAEVQPVDSQKKTKDLPVNNFSLGGSDSYNKKTKLVKELKSLGGDKKVEAALFLKEVIKDHGVLFIGLLETKINSQDNSYLLKFLGTNWNSFVVPFVGLSGGIMVIWRNDLVDFSVIEASSQMILGKLEAHGKGSWIVASVYGSTDANERKRLWIDIERHCSTDLPMVVGGDFNCVLFQSEKRGGKKFCLNQGSKDFNNIMIINDLHEVRSMGPSIHLAIVKHLSRIASDHCPLLLDIFKPVKAVKRDNRYEETWASYHGAVALVKKIWLKNYLGDPPSALNLKLKRTLRGLFYWRKAKFMNLNLLRDKLKNENLEIQLEEDEGWISFDRLQLLRFKINELNVTLARLNTWWRQRAKARWMDKGDCNSSFFHTFDNARRSNNWISHIKTMDGIISEEEAVIQKTLSDFFKLKWQYRKCSLDGWPNPSTVISNVDQIMLEAKFTREELQ